jgi:hypothetical protein
MGADIYLRSITEPARDHYHPLFEQAVARRNAAVPGSEAEASAQAEVTRLYAAMYPEDGYLRDSYNASSLFWVLDLSWWKDVGSLLDEEGLLAPQHCATLAADLAQRSELLEGKIARRDAPFDGADWEEAATYFRAKLERFVAFFRRAAEMDEAPYCSI